MSSFIRRFSSMPPLELLSAIEGVVIIDSPPPGSVQGQSVGIAGLVGEFADMTYAVSVDEATGNVTTKPQPVQILSGADLLDKLGGFDETLGEFGGDCGNGFVELRNKKFAGLVVVPVNLACAKGVRLWRELPTCKSSTNPDPIVPVQAASVAAGREFKSGANRVRVAQKVTFYDDLPRCSGTDGNTATVGPAATAAFQSAGGAFIVNGVTEGDILVLGVIGGAGYLGSNAGTYRVVSVDSATQVTVQKLDGSNFSFVDEAAAAQPWRIYPARVADTGKDHQLSEAQGYLIPARTLDATIAAATTVSPTVVPDAASATSWDPLSGLKMRTDPATGLVHDANVQAANAANHASIDALYSLALDTLLDEQDPARKVNLVWSARKANSSVNGIASLLRSNALTASSQGRGRRAFISPALDVVTLTSAKSASAPGVATYRSERVNYNWPGVRTLVPEAVGFSVKGADGKTYTDGIIDTGWDGWNVVLCSNLAPERNPGQVASPVDVLMAAVLGLQRGAPTLRMADYIDMKQNGIAAPRLDPDVGYVTLQSGVTSSLTSGQKNQNRRAFADYYQDSVAARLAQLAKLPITEGWKTDVLNEIAAFCEELKSPANPTAQRIVDYALSTKGNTDAMAEAGVYLITSSVKMLATGDTIVFQTNIGPSVNITTAQ